MKRKFLKTVAGCMAAAVLFLVPGSAKPVHSAECAVLLDATAGRILYEQNPHKKVSVASTTKIMTGLLIAEACDPNAMVSVPKDAVGVEGSSLYLKEGETLSVEALLYGMMLHSGNDASVALAMYCAGSVPAFAEKMNRRAEEIGLQNTNYVNPNGLDADEQYSSAADLAKLTAVALENELFRQVVSTKSISFGARTFTNHNRLLWQYEGAIGVKTGYTMSAGRILVSSAERNGRRLIAVTVRDRNDWADHKTLLDYGFSHYSQKELAHCGQIMGSVPVMSGGEPEVEAVLQEDIFWCLGPEEQVELTAELPLFVYAPILAGEKAGMVHVILNGVQVKSVPLYWRYSVLEEA